MNVYYALYESDICGELYDCILFVEQGHYDSVGGLDDGSEPEYKLITTALWDIGMSEMQEAMFAFMSLDESQMVSLMRERGFNMIRKDDILKY